MVQVQPRIQSTKIHEHKMKTAAQALNNRYNVMSGAFLRDSQSVKLGDPMQRECNLGVSKINPFETLCGTHLHIKRLSLGIVVHGVTISKVAVRRPISVVVRVGTIVVSIIYIALQISDISDYCCT